MQQYAKPQYRVALLQQLVDFLQLFVAMYISQLVVATPAFGGALYVACRFWLVYARLFGKKMRAGLPSSIRNKGIALLCAGLLVCAALLVFFPWVAQQQGSEVALVAVALLFLRQRSTDALAQRAKKSWWLPVSAVHLFYVALWALLFYSLGFSADGAAAMVGLGATGLVLFFKQAMIHQHGVVDAAALRPSADRFAGVSSYNIYNRMLVNIFIAVNLTILSYIFYLKYLPYSGFLANFAGLLGWVALVSGITALFLFLLNRKRRYRYQKAGLFAVGVAVWLGTMVLVFRGALSLGDGLQGLVVWGLFGFSLACLLSIIVSMGVEMRGVIELGLGELDEQAYAHNTIVMLNWSSLLSYLLILVVFSLASFLMNGQLAFIDELPVLPAVIQQLFLLLPLVCVVASLVFLILQPLDKQYVEKLRRYNARKKKGELSEPLEAQLKRVLVTKAPRRIGIRIAKALVRPFVPLRVVGKQNVKKNQMPVVFVCNHYEIYGPLAAVLRLPYYFRPWIINDAVDTKLIRQKLYTELARMLPKLPKKLISALCGAAAPIAGWIIRSQDPIAVHRSSRGIVDTMNQTVEALECEDNILIFPENPIGDDGQKHYETAGVGEFFTGFSSIGRYYYKKTQKRVVFVPVYVNKEKRRLFIGEGLRYNPAANKSEEKLRIVTELQSRMAALSQL